MGGNIRRPNIIIPKGDHNESKSKDKGNLVVGFLDDI